MGSQAVEAEQLTKLCLEHFMTCISFHVVSGLIRDGEGQSLVTPTVLPHYLIEVTNSWDVVLASFAQKFACTYRHDMIEPHWAGNETDLYWR